MKEKKRHVGLSKNQTHWNLKGQHPENENTAHIMGENVYKSYSHGSTYMKNAYFLKKAKDLNRYFSMKDIEEATGARVVQWGGRLTWAQVMISQFVSSSPTSGSALTARSREPTLDSVSPSLCLPCSCSFSQK